MVRKSVASLSRAVTWTCRQCQLRSKTSLSHTTIRASLAIRPLSTLTTKPDTLEVHDTGIEPTGFEITAAPPINFDKKSSIGAPARVVPTSASYFTTSPLFNDHILHLTNLAYEYDALPTVASADQKGRMTFMTLEQARSSISEKIGAAKYARLINLLKRLDQIDPRLRPTSVQMALEQFRRPGSGDLIPPRPKTMDRFGRTMGVGRRKSAVARVQLVEGTGEVLVNGKSISQAFARLHDRESAVWPLKITNRLDKYNVFVAVNGGGPTGQAESITLGLANALMVHEPVLKPTLRKAGCITRIMKRVERKKTGRVKARKKPAWVKR
ncbi:uncharacterized protein HMPREF1541_04391 [Cyphellophora europaea CBS 101466]|uniref:Small ribosomal subunit protein uS9m n=1 Tax=Cyphellophora europaea (strain CBS 101466) TaxID=1220924 RepID=W2RUC0_CYPE1|nr:uncharacterized protein HMPREF1541_04391 [Cyphellophora europaea CBS 101466]ETN40116.1 hypothetical protein HMPREF1541_04391 [Cyphellophora europaea CBS 101466]